LEIMAQREGPVKYLYYPGCSLKGTAVDYEESFLTVAPALGLEVKELKEWVCCGATAVKSMDKGLAESLALDTLVKALPEGLDLIMLCPSCHGNHLELAHKVKDDPSFKEKYAHERIPEIKQLLEVLGFDLGINEIKRRIRLSLKGLRVLPYYGCLVVRPFSCGGRESMENPRVMENVMAALDGHPLSFPFKLDCCGGALLLTKEKVALKLAGTILREAKKLSPDCLVVTCPLCHFMLDAKQRAIEKEIGEKIRIPVLYLTQLIGIALGLEQRKLGLFRLITSPEMVLRKMARGL